VARRQVAPAAREEAEQEDLDIPTFLRRNAD
jgi:hypothetical protein